MPFQLPSSLRASKSKTARHIAQEPQQGPSLGEFEVHVASIRAGTASSASSLAKFVEIPLDGQQRQKPLHIVIPKSSLVASTVAEQDSDDEDDTKKCISRSSSTPSSPFDVASSEKIVVLSEEEEKTLARSLFLYGFCECLDSCGKLDTILNMKIDSFSAFLGPRRMHPPNEVASHTPSGMRPFSRGPKRAAHLAPRD